MLTLQTDNTRLTHELKCSINQTAIEADMKQFAQDEVSKSRKIVEVMKTEKQQLQLKLHE